MFFLPRLLVLFCLLLFPLVQAQEGGFPLVQAQEGGLAPQDLSRIREYARVITSYAGQVWPQWKQPPPLLLRTGDADYLIGYPLLAPPTFESLNLQALDHFVYRSKDHLLPTPTVMAWPVGSIWTVAIPTLPELQRAIDSEIGAGILKLSEQFYMRSLLHEAVHAFVFTQMHNKLPLFGFVGDEGEQVKHLEGLANFNQQVSQEGKLLAQALLAGAEVRSLVGEFLLLRQKRRAQLSQQAVALERAMEWKEGLSRYTEVRLLGLLGGQKNPELNLNYPPAERTWNEFLAQCSLPVLLTGALRERYTSMGAAQAFLLDQLMPGWKARVLGGESLEDVLAQAIK